MGQVFRMAMYHENHPAKDYEIANRVEVFDEPAGHCVATRDGGTRHRGTQLRRLDLAL